MVRRSSYRLGRRLRASQKDRLDYITYLQSEGMPTRNGTVTPAELVVRMRASMGGGGELATTLAPIPHNLGADFAAGGAFRGNIFPPVTLQGHFAGGGLMRAKLDAVPKILTARFAGGGEMTAYTPPAVLMSVSMSGGGTMTADIAEAADGDAAAVIAAMTVAPSPERQNAINNFISGLKVNGIWAELDQLYVMAAHDAQAARVNWKNPAQALAVVGAPEFLTDTGYLSNAGKTAYLNAPVSFATSANWQDTNACLFSRCIDIGRTHETCVAIGAGAGGDTTILGYNATEPNMSMRINASANVSAALYDTPADFIAVQREDSADIKGFFNGVNTSTTARVAGVSSADTVSILAWNGGGTRTNHNVVYPQAIAGWGAALSDAQHVALYNLSEAYLDALVAEATSELISTMTVTPDAGRQTLISTLIADLRAAHVWDKLDCLYILAAHDEQAARLNWKNAALFEAVEVGSPVFIADTSYAGAAGANCLNSGFTPSVDAVRYSQNNACLFGYFDGINTLYDDNYNIGAYNATSYAAFYPARTDNTFRGFINTATSFNFGDVVANSGVVAVNRSAATATQGYANGAAVGTNAAASNGVPTGDFAICGGFNIGSASFVGSARPMKAAGWGASLNATEQAALNTAITDYTSAIEPDTDAADLIAAMSPAPDTARQTLINNTVADLKAAGLWDKLDVLYVHAAHSKQAGSLNWKTPATLGLNPTGTYTHTVDVGISRNGAVIPTDVNFVVDAADYVYAQNSGHIGAWVANGNTAPTAIVFQNTDGTNSASPFTALNLRSTNDATGFVNSGTAIIGPVVPEDTAGHWVISRTGATASALRHNGVELTTSAAASAALTGGRLYLLRDATYTSIQQITHVGGGLTGTEIATLYDILSDYLASL